MKKRIISLLLAIVMVVGMLPTQGHVHAVEVENPVCYCAEHCTADNFNEYCEVCAVDYTACNGEGEAVAYADTVTLYFNNTDNWRLSMPIIGATRILG